jgi:hypothetical protein
VAAAASGARDHQEEGPVNSFGEKVNFIWPVADSQDSDEYRAQSVFWVLPESCWAQRTAQARRPTIGQLPTIMLSRTTAGNGQAEPRTCSAESTSTSRSSRGPRA